MSSAPLAHVRSFLVPLDGSEAAYRALDAACGIACESGASVACLYVIEVPRTHALDTPVLAEVDRGEEVLIHAEDVGSRHGLSIRAEMVQARQAGHAVVDEVDETGVDAIVVGLEYHRPYGRFELGGLPEYVLANAPCEVWLMRERPADGELQEPEELFMEAGHLLPRTSAAGDAEAAPPADAADRGA